MRLLYIISIVFIFSCSEKRLPYYTSGDLQPKEENSNSHQIAEFEFTDQHDKPFSSAEIEGKIYVADFFFTTCQGICIDMTRNLKKIQEKFLHKTNLHILSFTVDPETDNVIRMNEYMKEKGITSPNWHLLTGTKKKLYELGMKYFFAGEYKYFNEEESFIHSKNIYLVDPNKHIRGVYDGTESKEMKRLGQDIELLKKEFPNVL